jgi:hypothetical protein
LLPQLPQLVLESTIVSQPLSAVGAGGLVQLPRSIGHVDVQSPPEHASDITLLVEQARPQAPQCCTLVCVSTSHPVCGF